MGGMNFGVNIDVLDFHRTLFIITFVYVTQYFKTIEHNFKPYICQQLSYAVKSYFTALSQWPSLD